MIVTLGAAQSGSASEPSYQAQQRTEPLAHELRVLLDRAIAERYDHLIFRVPAGDPALTWAAERAGLSLVDVGVDSTLALRSTVPPPFTDAQMIRPAVRTDLPFLCDVSARAFTHSRFAVDPFFSPEMVDRFYRAWVTNLFNGDAQMVLVSEHDEARAGFVACALRGDEGRIQLIATRVDRRGCGVGRGLVIAALRWFADSGARLVHVKTQVHNYPALALYHRLGFVVSRSELTFSTTL